MCYLFAMPVWRKWLMASVMMMSMMIDVETGILRWFLCSKTCLRLLIYTSLLLQASASLHLSIPRLCVCLQRPRRGMYRGGEGRGRGAPPGGPPGRPLNPHHTPFRGDLLNELTRLLEVPELRSVGSVVSGNCMGCERTRVIFTKLVVSFV